MAGKFKSMNVEREKCAETTDSERKFLPHHIKIMKIALVSVQNDYFCAMITHNTSSYLVCRLWPSFVRSQRVYLLRNTQRD